jgi:hypothetical protein
MLLTKVTDRRKERKIIALSISHNRYDLPAQPQFEHMFILRKENAKNAKQICRRCGALEKLVYGVVFVKTM